LPNVKGGVEKWQIGPMTSSRRRKGKPAGTTKGKKGCRCRQFSENGKKMGLLSGEGLSVAGQARGGIFLSGGEKGLKKREGEKE